jgi:hypothetical protein
LTRGCKWQRKESICNLHGFPGKRGGKSKKQLNIRLAMYVHQTLGMPILRSARTWITRANEDEIGRIGKRPGSPGHGDHVLLHRLPQGLQHLHHQFKRPVKKATVTIPHPKKNLPTKTIKRIFKQAGLEL